MFSWNGSICIQNDGKNIFRCNTNDADYVRYTLYSELKTITSEKKTSRSGETRYAENDRRLMAGAMGGLPAEGKFYLSINFERMERFVLFSDFFDFYCRVQQIKEKSIMCDQPRANCFF